LLKIRKRKKNSGVARGRNSHRFFFRVVIFARSSFLLFFLSLRLLFVKWTGLLLLFFF